MWLKPKPTAGSRLRGALTATCVAFALSACAQPILRGPASGNAASEGEFELQTGQSRQLPEGLLRFVAVESDSRCPPAMDCIWAGDAQIRLHWTPLRASPLEFSLHLPQHPRSETLGALRLELRELSRDAVPLARFSVGPASP